MTDWWRERICSGLGEFLALGLDSLNVAICAGDVAASGAAVVDVRGDERIVCSAKELACRLGGVEDAALTRWL